MIEPIGPKLPPVALDALEKIRVAFGDNIALGGGAVIDTLTGVVPNDYDVQLWDPQSNGWWKGMNELVQSADAALDAQSLPMRGTASSFHGWCIRLNGLSFDILDLSPGPQGLIDKMHLSTDLAWWQWWKDFPVLDASIPAGKIAVLNAHMRPKGDDSATMRAVRRVIKAQERQARLRATPNLTYKVTHQFNDDQRMAVIAIHPPEPQKQKPLIQIVEDQVREQIIQEQDARVMAMITQHQNAQEMALRKQGKENQGRVEKALAKVFSRYTSIALPTLVQHLSDAESLTEDQIYEGLRLTTRAGMYAFDSEMHLVPGPMLTSTK